MILSSIHRLGFRLGLALAIVSSLSAAATDKKRPKEPSATDKIVIVGHLALKADPALNLVTSTHWRRNYLYIEHGSQGAVTIVDVTNPKTPKSSGEFVPPPGSAELHIGEVQGSAAMFTSAKPRSAPQSPENVTIVSFDDPVHPRVVQQFSNVSCLLKDTERGLIYFVNNDGLWILHSTPAPDREFDEEYEKYIRYSH